MARGADWWNSQYIKGGKVIMPVWREPFPDWSEIESAKPVDLSELEYDSAEIDLRNELAYVPGKLTWNSVLAIAAIIQEAKKGLGISDGR